MSNPSSLLNAEPILPLDDTTTPARIVLDRLAILGLLDAEHLADLTRSARENALKQLTDAGYLTPLEVRGHLRAGRTGRAPSAYALTLAGAATARALGHDHAHAYEQTNHDNQAHDLCTLDVHFAACRAGLNIVTERNLINAPHVVRPDNAVGVSTGPIGLFETEGFADTAQRPRLLEKVMHWNASAAALHQAGVDLRVRVLFNLKSDRALQTTYELWANVIATAQATLEQPLALQFWGRPIGEFLQKPVWDSLDGFTRLDDPARAKDFGLAPEAARPNALIGEPLDLLPAALRRQATASADDVILLRAYARYFTAHLLPEIPPYSPAFFDLVREIHGAAGAAEADQRLAIPVVALWMLRTYLANYPDLQQALSLAYRKFNRINSVLMAQRAATRLVRTFLTFHGLRHDSADCLVRVLPPDLQGERDSDFNVHVQLRLPDAFDGVPRHNWAQFQMDTACALAWVLQQLLDYPDELGLTERA